MKQVKKISLIILSAIAVPLFPASKDRIIEKLVNAGDEKNPNRQLATVRDALSQGLAHLSSDLIGLIVGYCGQHVIRKCSVMFPSADSHFLTISQITRGKLGELVTLDVTVHAACKTRTPWKWVQTTSVHQLVMDARTFHGSSALIRQTINQKHCKEMQAGKHELVPRKCPQIFVAGSSAPGFHCYANNWNAKTGSNELLFVREELVEESDKNFPILLAALELIQKQKI